MRLLQNKTERENTNTRSYYSSLAWRNLEPGQPRTSMQTMQFFKMRPTIRRIFGRPRLEAWGYSDLGRVQSRTS